MHAKTIERIEGSDLYDKFLTIGESVCIVTAVGWFTWTFTDGFLWIAIFGTGFYLGKRSSE
jgi:hypothetical protein